jgi:hypothetical protein
MTAEIAILNKEAIALAADSAVTFNSEQGQKIFTTANKIFTLSKYHPVGVMIYGNAVFHSAPWETIIKSYRKSVGSKEFDTVESQAADFLAYIERAREFSPEKHQDALAHALLFSYFQSLRDRILKRVHQGLEERGTQGMSEKEALSIVADEIDDDYEIWRRAQPRPRATTAFAQTLRRKFGSLAQKLIGEIFEKLPLTRSQLRALREIATMLFLRTTRHLSPPFRTGIVIAGFGAADYFPKCLDYSIIGVVANRLIYRDVGQHRIGDEHEAIIAPFAQDDVARAFIEGVDPRYERAIGEDLSRILTEYPKEILDVVGGLTRRARRQIEKKLMTLGASKVREYASKLREFRRDRFVGPTLNVVAMLPKDELANMAETLVNLTSFKRRFSMAAETVGGPADVAVISKGDGFVWIKRKHYFKSDLNPHFIGKYLRELEHGDEV